MPDYHIIKIYKGKLLEIVLVRVLHTNKANRDLFEGIGSCHCGDWQVQGL